MNTKELLRTYDLDFFGQGKHKITLEKITEAVKTNEIELLDVRTKEEMQLTTLNLGLHIPLNELAERTDELPKDKTIAIYCAAGTRAAIAFLFLQEQGFTNVRIFTGKYGDLVSSFKAGYIRKNKEILEF